MTLTIRKLHLAIAILAVAVMAPATALATHVFDDVPDTAFYADAVEWAADKNITQGTSPTTFDPEATVTRGQAVTFLKRYDDNIVQPALDALPTIYTARVNSDGTLITGSPGVTSTTTGTGVYRVDFPADVKDCIWNATPTSSGAFFFVIDTTEIFATATGGYNLFPFPGSPIAERVWVNIWDEDGAAQNWRFDLSVIC